MCSAPVGCTFFVGSARHLASDWVKRIIHKGTAMLQTLGFLLGCQLLGEITVRGFGLAIPGPVLGLALLVALLGSVPVLAERLRPTTSVILANLSFLFVPAGVGVIGNLRVLSDDGLALLIILILSTLLSMLAAVGTFIGVRHLTESRSS